MGAIGGSFVRKALELAKQRKAMAAMLLPLPWITGRKVADLTGGPTSRRWSYCAIARDG